MSHIMSYVSTYKELTKLASRLPCRTICGEQGPYLSRYTLSDMPDGGHVYLHFFHRGDADQELHNHPWSGTSIILAGGYKEERRVGSTAQIERRVYGPGETNVLEPDTYHRIDLIGGIGCWTLFTVSPKVQSWGFWDRHTGITTPWREALARRGLEVSR